MTINLPLAEPLGVNLEPERVFERLAHLPHCLFLDSSAVTPDVGRYSFLAADPFEYLELPADRCGEGMPYLERRLSEFASPDGAGVPPFQGGASCLLIYDFCRAFEAVPRTRFDDFQVPVFAVGLYDVVIAFDHQSGEAWIVSQGFPAKEQRERCSRARDRLQQFRAWLTSDSPAPPRTVGDRRGRVATPQHATHALNELTSNFTADGYREQVARVIEYIFAGDIFQANLSQRLLYPARQHAVCLYQRLRRENPAPFAAYFDLGNVQVVSASPERFLNVRAGIVESRPIKGTRPRLARAEADLYRGDELRHSEKDRAENVMILDLMRNDLSRVCLADSVQVSQLCEVERFQFVQHLVSVVHGALPEETPCYRLIPAAFPGGSITGAPKVRAMEIISELELTARGPYCGSLGYIGFNGNLDLSILIRTITASQGWWQIPVGGGIVAQSDPRREYEETWHKAEGMLRAIS